MSSVKRLASRSARRVMALLSTSRLSASMAIPLR
jgi:hypothetical protein